MLHYLVERAALPVILNLLHRERNVLALRFTGTLVQHHQLAATGVRQGPQKHAVDHAEDGGVDPDSERERGNGDCRETRILEKDPEGVADILKQHMASSTISRVA